MGIAEIWLLATIPREVTSNLVDHGQQVFDRVAVRRHRDRAASRIGRVLPLLQEAGERLLDRLNDTTRRFTTALDVGGRGVVGPMLRGRGIGVVSCDLSPQMAALEAGPVVVADEEFLPFAAASFDLVVASLSLHWVNDLPGVLTQLRRALRPEGLLLASLPAFGTLETFRASLANTEAALTGGASPRVSPFIGLQDGAALLLRAGFALPVADSDDLEVAYLDRSGLVADLRAGGESNAIILRSRHPPPRGLFRLSLASMPERDGRMPETLRLAILTGWAPAD